MSVKVPPSDQSPAAEEGALEEEQKTEEAKKEEKAKADEDEISPEKRERLKAEERQGGFRERKDTRFESQDLRERLLDLPKQFGQRINTNPHVAKEQVAQQNQFRPQPKENQSLPGSQSRGQTSQPIPEKNLKAFVKEPLFQGPLKNSTILQRLQARVAGENLSKQTYILKEGENSVLEKNNVLNFFRHRNQFKDQDTARRLLRDEIARQREAQRQDRVPTIKQQAQGKEGESQVITAQRQNTAQDLLTQNLQQKLQNSAQTAFESILQKVLAGGKTVPQLPSGTLAKFAAKTEAQWQKFFQNVTNLNSSELKAEGKLGQLLSALYRGLYAKGEGGKLMLVADLNFGEAGGEHKFSQIELEGKLAEALRNLQPGDVISRNLLQNLGEEFVYLRLAHLVSQAQLSEEQKQAILREYRKQMSPTSRQNIENALFDKKQRDQKTKHPFEWAGDQFDKKQRFSGRPKIFMFMLYGVVISTILLIIYLLSQYL